MNDENIPIIERKIIKMYSHDFLTKIYTFFRLKLSPIAKIEKYVPKSGNILDLGCGTGIFANILYLGSQERTILGVDLMNERIKTAKKISKKKPQLQFIVGDVSNVELDVFEIVTLIDLLHHMPFSKQDNLLKRIFINLRKGGLVLIKDLEKNPNWKYIFHCIQDFISYKGSKLYFRSAEEMESLLMDIGFKVEIISLASAYPHPHVLYRCIKKI